MLALLALGLALRQQPAVLDLPVWRDSTWRVALPRPFDDWVFAPGAGRVTATVIFQPREGHVSDQLFGALVLTRWGAPVPLAAVVDRRLRETWRATLGPSFTLLARDSLALDGWPAAHLVMSGAIQHAVLDVEEYLVARDSDLVVLQLRYPRGVEHDSIAAGYQRTVSGLRLGAAGLMPGAAAWRFRVDGGEIAFDLPDSLAAVAPGALTIDASSGNRRLMRWRPVFGEPDTTLFTVGRYRLETRRVGRLALRIWRGDEGDTALTRVGDDVAGTLARDFGIFWRAFGPIPLTELTIVETPWPSTRGAGGAVFLGRDATPVVLARELSRTWWGGAVRADSSNEVLVDVALPLLAARLATGDSSLANDARLRALDDAERIAGSARFREAIRTFAIESRGEATATARLLAVLGDSASAVVRQLLVQQ